MNVAPFCGQTALHFAAQLGRTDVLDELLARGADVRVIETQFNGTAIDWAREGGHPEIGGAARSDWAVMPSDGTNPLPTRAHPHRS